MRTLDEIVAAVRSDTAYTEDEARYAIVAFDVLLSQLELDQDAGRLKEWMIAATNSPQEYIGEANDPENPDAVTWYRTMHGVADREASFLVLGHGGHGKGTFCKLLEDAYGLRSMSSSQAALPFIWPSLREASVSTPGGEWYRSQREAYARRGDKRELWKALISLYNTPDKTTLSRQILSQVPVYDGMRCAEEFEASRGLFDYIFWVDASKREGLDPSMGISRTDDMILIDNNGSLDDLLDQVEALDWLRNG